jgi:hypothetical protein
MPKVVKGASAMSSRIFKEKEYRKPPNADQAPENSV